MKKALLIGINYIGSDAELKGCINDVRSVYNFLVNRCGYLPSDIRILTEEAGRTSPTKVNIEENIKWLVANNMPGDTLVFHFSGHGASVADRNGDETDGRDEVLVPLDYKTRGVITDDWIYANMVKKVVKGCTLLGFTDCCHSGTMFDLKYNVQSNCKYKKGTNVRNITYNPIDWTNEFTLRSERSEETDAVVMLFTGCEDAQTSADAFIMSKHQGAFTNCLLETLERWCIRLSNNTTRFQNGKLKVNELLKESNARLKIKGFSQNSQLGVGHLKDLEKTVDF
jgi:hypothetical protein